MELTPTKLTCANIGDSRAILITSTNHSASEQQADQPDKCAVEGSLETISSKQSAQNPGVEVLPDIDGCAQHDVSYYLDNSSLKPLNSSGCDIKKQPPRNCSSTSIKERAPVLKLLANIYPPSSDQLDQERAYLRTSQ